MFRVVRYEDVDPVIDKHFSPSKFCTDHDAVQISSQVFVIERKI